MKGHRREGASGMFSFYMIYLLDISKWHCATILLIERASSYWLNMLWRCCVISSPKLVIDVEHQLITYNSISYYYVLSFY